MCTFPVLESNDDATPGVHDAFAQRQDVVNEIVVRGIILRDISCGIKHLSNGFKILLEMCTNGIGYVSEALEDCGLELIAE